MTNNMRFIHVCAALTMLCGAHAQSVSTAQTEDGRPVSRLEFDREQVTIIYADGTRETVDGTTIFWDSVVTGLEAVKTTPDTAPGKGDGIYDLQGRRVESENMTPGIYIERRGGKSVKIIKK